MMASVVPLQVALAYRFWEFSFLIVCHAVLAYCHCFYSQNSEWLDTGTCKGMLTAWVVRWFQCPVFPSYALPYV